MNNLPNIFLFNPTCEYAVANGNATWHPNQLLQKMEFDLATLPLFLAKPEDYILVDKLPSPNFIESLKSLQIQIPNFILKRESTTNQHFISQPKNKLLPWGWSPAAHKLLSPLKQFCSNEFKNSPVSNWQSEYRNLYSKKFSLGILEKLLAEINADYLLPSHLMTEICTTQNEFEILLKRWGKLMIKAPWSSSGRGLQPIKKEYIHPKLWEKLLGIVKDQGYAIAEPFLNKALDLAFEFELTKGKVKYLGISNFTADSNGQYQGNYLNGLPDGLSNEIVAFAELIPGKIINPLIKIIESSDLAKSYEGIFGVDTLIFWDDKNELKINPCLEINVRQNMGLLSFHFEKLIHSEKKGMFRTYYNPGTTFLQFKNEMELTNPLKIINHKIESGFFALTEACENTSFGAYLIV